MENNLYNNTTDIICYFINKFKNKKITAVDMTVGNGNDIFNICSIIGKESHIYGFDILEEAINKSTEKLKIHKNMNINLILDSHENIDNYIEDDLDLAIYNLGYLPKGNKNITTDYNTVINSLNKVFKILNKNGIILITFYPGHKSGKLESIEIEKYLKTKDQKKYRILKFDFINQVNNPPYVIVIERLI